MRVSVLINNFNYGRYIQEAINSVLSQTYTGHIEIIVYDDGSTDESDEIVKSFGDKVIYIKNKNYGKSPSVNQANAIYQAFLKSKGDIICLLDSDDVFMETKIEKIVNKFLSNEKIVMVQHPHYEINKKGVTKKVKPLLKKIDNINDYIQRTGNLFNIYSTTSGLSFKRNFLEKVLPLKEDNYNYIWPDTRLSILATKLGEICTIYEPLGYYRIHENNHSKQISGIKEHAIYTNQLYGFYNDNAVKYNYPQIIFNQDNLFKYSIFLDLLDVNKVNNFLKGTVGSITIWGAGEAGQAIFAYLAEKNINVDYIIDSNVKMEGLNIKGVEIVSPANYEFSDKSKIIISAYYAEEEIRSYLEDKGLIENQHFLYPYFRNNLDLQVQL